MGEEFARTTELIRMGFEETKNIMREGSARTRELMMSGFEETRKCIEHVTKMVEQTSRNVDSLARALRHVSGRVEEIRSWTGRVSLKFGSWFEDRMRDGLRTSLKVLM